MSRKALQISCSPRVKNLLEKGVKQRQLEAHYSKRMQIICYSLSGKPNQEIGQILGILDQTVRKWRRRWKENQELLKDFEHGAQHIEVKDKELMDKIKEILSDVPRPGAPSRITNLEIIRLQALACENPEKYGLPFTNWTHEALSTQAKKMGIIISAAHYGRI